MKLEIGDDWMRRHWNTLREKVWRQGVAGISIQVANQLLHNNNKLMVEKKMTKGECTVLSSSCNVELHCERETSVSMQYVSEPMIQQGSLELSDFLQGQKNPQKINYLCRNSWYASYRSLINQMGTASLASISKSDIYLLLLSQFYRSQEVNTQLLNEHEYPPVSLCL